MEDTITSIDEFNRKYFPKFYQKKKEEKLFRKGTPEEIGEYFAQKTIEKFKSKLNKILIN